MRLTTLTLLQTALFGSSFLFSSCVAQASGIVQTYCSSQNTGSDNSVDNWPYQSMGRCKTRCEGSYAFAIVQYQNCWCSNYVPANTVSTSQCNQKCPGYPDDQCGNLDAGLFGYIALANAPSGTKGASSSSPKTTTTSQTTSSSPTTTTTSSSLQVTSQDTLKAAVTSVQVVTVSGAVVYKTVTSTPVPASAQDSSIQRVDSSGLPGGAIAGIVIGVLAAVAILLVGLFLLWRRRKAQQQEEMTNEKGGRTPKRNISVLSRSGLVGRGSDGTAERDFDEPIHPGSQRHSMLFGAGAVGDGVSPVSPLETSYSGDSRRHSKPMVYDQRLNPSALFATHDNGSRASMQDGADYSRTLGVTNPDPRASFESRMSRP